MSPHIGLTKQQLSGSVKILSILLADEMVLYVKTRKSHWNVMGSNFMEYHKLFQTQYTELEENIDLIAERISKLGGKTIGTMKEYLDLARLKELPGKYPVAADLIQELLRDHEELAIQLRTDIVTSDEKNKDAGTTDFLTGLTQQHESIAWILRRTLQ